MGVKKIPKRNNANEKDPKVREKNEQLVERIPVQDIEKFSYHMLTSAEDIFNHLKEILNKLKVLSEGDEYQLIILSKMLHQCNTLSNDLDHENLILDNGKKNPKWDMYMSLITKINPIISSIGLNIKSRSTLYSANIIKPENPDDQFKGY